MAFLNFSYRLGTSFATYKIRLKVTVISTYIMVSNIPLSDRLPCPEVTFLLRKSRDPERRCYMNVIILSDFDKELSY
jgi:hypothetical protein